LEGQLDGERQWPAHRGPRCTHFFCKKGICNTLIPLTAYYFANVGEIAAGGAFFTTDANGDGPTDNADRQIYFNGDYRYWTGYRNTSSDSSWFDIPAGGGYQCKATRPWDTAANSAKGGVYGQSTFTNKNRWRLATIPAISPITSSAT
jgi:hypothetical protein